MDRRHLPSSPLTAAAGPLATNRRQKMIFQDDTRDYAMLDRLYGRPVVDCNVQNPGLICRLKALFARH